ncbi:hypothetical protein LF65_02986 [Clostridium beijerinckii]|uniref:DUF1189 domain-containing protein n=1 Tax=Clostridium beijerinckii TaxID=1520 RepID=A0A0B5QMR6_CLOBE|nr:DUF1189 domain-containing protein [Clostridium beijerinckii]AJG99556.1 hypothetical protein LF65_02986 [Clostridium beijerinckii]
MKKIMGFKDKFAYSFFNFEAYSEFLAQGLRKSILYVFLVTLLFSVITNVKEINMIASEISVVQNDLSNNAPNFEFKNGVLSVDSDETIYNKHEGDFLFYLISSFIGNINTVNSLDSDAISIQDNLENDSSTFSIDDSMLSVSTDQSNYYTFIIDTKGKTDKNILNSYKNAVLLDSNNIYLRKDYRTVGTINFSDFSSININNENSGYYLSIIKILTPIVFFVVNPINSFITNLILGFLIFGPFAVSIGSFMGVKLKYSRACTLSFYAMSLPLLLEALIHVAGIIMPEFFLIFSIITLIYCSLAIREIKNSDKSELNFMK